jgi:hypothetical protein
MSIGQHVEDKNMASKLDHFIDTVLFVSIFLNEPSFENVNKSRFPSRQYFRLLESKLS